MPRIEKTVFISYRRTNAPWALAIYQHLSKHGYDVFFDYQSIASGDFEQVILQHIKARAHFIVVLTPSALERCEEPGDWLRREIEAALETKRNIVPLMLEGFNFGSPSIGKYLTGELAALKSYNGLPVPVEYFEEAMARLRERYLNVPLEAVLHPVSNVAQQVVKRQQAAASAAPAVAANELTAQAWKEQGKKHYHARKYSEAIHAYGEAIRLKPGFVEAYNNRGLVHKAKGDVDGALRDYDDALHLAPDFAPAYCNRGTVYQDKGDLDSALRDYDEALHLAPDLTEAYHNRGLARKAKGDVAGAIADYQKYLDLGGGIKNGDQKKVEKIIRDLKKKR
jgi:tetratricopeptide (TPR) repeat protein